MIKKGTTCKSKEELIELLKDWLKTNEPTIGNIENHTKNTKWLILSLNNKEYFFNADTRREGVKKFVENHDGNKWMITKNSKGKYNKVTNDPNTLAIKYLYFYTNTFGEREI